MKIRFLKNGEQEGKMCPVWGLDTSGSGQDIRKRRECAGAFLIT
jgi:hypothetical protein